MSQSDLEVIYADYPACYNLLRDNAGNLIDNPVAWEKRCCEILDIMLREVYGYCPGALTPVFSCLKCDDHALGDTARLRVINIQLSHRDQKIDPEKYNQVVNIQLNIFLPQSAKPVPVFLFLANRTADLVDPNRTEFDEFWAVDVGLSRGYGMAAVRVAEIAHDQEDSLESGVFNLFSRPRHPDSWGTLRAWAWGGSRCLDYLRRCPEIDPDRIAVIGHSRGGKTALLAAATDPRFALAISNDSGCTGASLARRGLGETIADINRVLPYWTCDNYKAYNGLDNPEHELPFDQHFLISCIAPRAVYVASASEDGWADPEGEYYGLRLSEPVYKLYGLGGLPAAWPALDQPVITKKMGYHIRPGKHGVMRSDWVRYCDFADKNM